MSHRSIVLIATAILILAFLLFVRLHVAAGRVLPEAVSAGHRLAAVWCQECHAIEAKAMRIGNTGPDFVKIANQSSTTALSLNVFLRSNHTRMPNFIIAPDDAAEIVRYILSLKRN